MKKKVVFSPYSSGTNKYINIFVRELIKNGYEVISMREFLFSYNNFIETKIIHLNWFEDLIGNVWYKRLFDFFRKIFLLLLFRISKKKIVWTMHNKQSHIGDLMFFRKTLRNIVEKQSCSIIIHCLESTKLISDIDNIKEKVIYLPHPNYIGEYGLIKHEEVSDDNQILHLLFLGALKPYKNIELLFQLANDFKDSIYIVIAGNPSNKEYKEKLCGFAENLPNVDLIPNFIQDEQLPEFIEKCDLMIIPLDLKSSLNSGSVILSFSYKKSVICPNIGTLKDVGVDDAMFTYEYSCEKDHYRKLKEKVNEAINQKLLDKESLKHFGEKVFDYVSVHNSKEKIIKVLNEVYS